MYAEEQLLPMPPGDSIRFIPTWGDGIGQISIRKARGHVVKGKTFANFASTKIFMSIYMILLVVSGTGISKAHSIRHHQVGIKGKKTGDEVESNDIKNSDAGAVLMSSTSTVPFMLELQAEPQQQIRLDCIFPPDIAPMHFTLGKLCCEHVCWLNLNLQQSRNLWYSGSFMPQIGSWK